MTAEAPTHAKLGSLEESAESKFEIMVRLLECDTILKRMFIDYLKTEVKNEDE